MKYTSGVCQHSLAQTLRSTQCWVRQSSVQLFPHTWTNCHTNKCSATHHSDSHSLTSENSTSVTLHSRSSWRGLVHRILPVTYIPRMSLGTLTVSVQPMQWPIGLHPTKYFTDYAPSEAGAMTTNHPRNMFTFLGSLQVFLIHVHVIKQWMSGSMGLLKNDTALSLLLLLLPFPYLILLAHSPSLNITPSIKSNVHLT